MNGVLFMIHPKLDEVQQIHRGELFDPEADFQLATAQHMIDLKPTMTVVCPNAPEGERHALSRKPKPRSSIARISSSGRMERARGSRNRRRAACGPRP